MEELIEDIKKALTKFAYNDLCEGADVRDTLLDLMIKAQGLTGHATPNVSVLPTAKVLEQV